MDLHAVTNDELIDELFSRHEQAVFVGRPLVNRDYDWQTRAKGKNHEIMGLCAMASAEAAKSALHPPT